nr:hypothetical protein [Candidatus Freyrarchaeum guaymaensis]
MAWFRGWGRGRGRRWWWWSWWAASQSSTTSQSPTQAPTQPSPPAPRGYRYIGPCRCGFGPNAFYQDPQGRIVHASQIFWGSPAPTPVTPYTEEAREETIEEKIEKLREKLEELAEEIRESSDQQPSRWWPFKKQD